MVVVNYGRGVPDLREIFVEIGLFYSPRSAICRGFYWRNFICIIEKYTSFGRCFFLMKVKYVSVNCFLFGLNLIGNFSTERLLIMRVF